MSELRVGLIGSGFGVMVHLPALSLHPRFTVTAIASPKNAERIATERKIPHAFRSTAELLAGTEVDVVVVASPPFDHHRSVMAAIEAGKHVLCEKPMALTLAEAEEMADALERRGVAGTIAFEFRWVPEIIALRELIDNRHLGALREIEVARLSRELRAANRLPDRWWFDARKGGGVANAVMPHFFDLANLLAGRRARHTSGFLRTANAERVDPDGNTFGSTVADGAFALVDYGDGLVAKISTDSTTIVESTTVAVHGERRSGVANGTFLLDQTLFAIDEDEQDELDVAPMRYAKHAIVHPQVPLMLELYDAFAERIDLGGGDAPTFRDGLEVQRMLDAIGFGRF